MADKHTLVMTGLTYAEAVEISERGSSLMWSDEKTGKKAYPSDDQEVAIIRNCLSGFRVVGIKKGVEIL